MSAIRKIIALSLAAVVAAVFSVLLSACGDAPAEATATELIVTNAKTVYTLGEEPTEGDVTVSVRYDDGSERTLSGDEYTMDTGAFHTRFPNSGKVTVSFGDLSAEYDVRAERAKSSFKVLAIGNSFSEDSLSHLYEMAEELGAEDIVLGNMYIGGCSLETHRENMAHDKAAYQYQKNTDGEWVKRDGWSLRRGIADEEWDVITVQQASGDSGMADTYNSDLDDLLQFVYLNRPSERTNVVWHMTWAYQGDSTHADFVNYNNDQSEMYEAIVSCVREKILPNKLIQYVIPTGTAIQDLRTAVGDNVTRDGYHLSYTTGRYTAGMTWLNALTGWDTDKLECDYFGLDDDVLSAIKESVDAAMKNPFEVTDLSADA